MILVTTTETYIGGKLVGSETHSRPWQGDGEDFHARCTSPETLRFYRALGGSERVTYGYTLAGRIITRLTSTSPDKRTKTVRTFDIV